MSAIHSRDTLPEVIVRKMLWENGYRFRVCDRRIVGHPDIVIPKCRALIEVRGCFWHQHGSQTARSGTPSSGATSAATLSMKRLGRQTAGTS